jgi:hypothetical protein
MCINSSMDEYLGFDGMIKGIQFITSEITAQFICPEA